MGARVARAAMGRRSSLRRGRGRRGRGRAAAAVYAERELHATAAASTAAAVATTVASAAAARRRRGRQHLGAQPLALGLRDGRRVYLVVREHHDQQRHVKGYGGREYQVAGAVGERARVPWHGLGADQPPPDDRREADHAAAHPHGRDQPIRAPPAHFRRVRERVGDGPVPVQRDHAQVQDRRGAEQHVQRPPHVARVYAERPVMVEHLVHRAHRHDHQPDQEVGERQRRDEVVGGRVQVPFAYHGYDHQAVAEHGHHAETHQHHGQRETVAERDRQPMAGRVRGRRVRVVVVIGRRRRGRRRARAILRRPVHRSRSRQPPRLSVAIVVRCLPPVCVPQQPDRYR